MKCERCKWGSQDTQLFALDSQTPFRSLVFRLFDVGQGQRMESLAPSRQRAHGAGSGERFGGKGFPKSGGERVDGRCRLDCGSSW